MATEQVNLTLKCNNCLAKANIELLVLAHQFIRFHSRCTKTPSNIGNSDPLTKLDNMGLVSKSDAQKLRKVGLVRETPLFDPEPLNRSKIEPLLTPRGRIKIGFWRRLKNLIWHGNPYGL
jgi:hypothetical protein